MPISDEDRKKQRENLAKRSASGMEQSYAEKNREVVESELAAMAPPMIVVKQCHVCMSPRRLFIEQMLLRNLSYSAISNSLLASGEDIDRRSISRHSKEHMKVQDAVTRAMMEQEANLIGQQYEEGVEGAFTVRGALITLARKGYDDAMAGTTTVEVKDIVQLLKQYNELEASTSSAAVEESKMAVRLFMEAIQNVTSDILEPEIGEEVRLAIAAEVKRLRSRDEIDTAVERHLLNG
jgi:hypothetical protein